MIDLSGSMSSNDAQGQVLDGVTQVISSLPSQYQVAVIGFHQDLVVDIPLTSLASRYNLTYLTDAISTMNYQGYSNAGLGLYTAAQYIQEGHVIFISDGELILPTQEGTEASKNLFREATLLLEEKEIPVHTIALGQWSEPSFMALVGELSGDFYPVTENYHEIWTKILQEQVPLSLSHEVFLEEQAFSWNLPSSQVDSWHLLLQSQEKISQFTWDYPHSSGKVGEYFAVVDLPQVHSQSFPFFIETESPSQLSLSLWGELTAIPMISYEYEDVFREDGQSYQRSALGLITFETQAGEPLFQDELIPSRIWVNGEEISMENGVITYVFDELSPIELTFHMELDPLVIRCDSLWAVPAPAPDLILEERNYGWMVAISVISLIFGVILGKSRESAGKSPKNKGKKEKKQNPAPKVKENKYNYVGKLKLELKQGREEFPTREFSLFRVRNHRSITLEEVLGTCYDISPKADTMHIRFSPWKNKNIALHHTFQGTLLYEQSILRKNQTYVIPVGGKIEISLSEHDSLVVIYEL